MPQHREGFSSDVRTFRAAIHVSTASSLSSKLPQTQASLARDDQIARLLMHEYIAARPNNYMYDYALNRFIHPASIRIMLPSTPGLLYDNQVLE